MNTELVYFVAGYFVALILTSIDHDRANELVSLVKSVPLFIAGIVLMCAPIAIPILILWASK